MKTNQIGSICMDEGIRASYFPKKKKNGKKEKEGKPVCRDGRKCKAVPPS